MATMTAGCTRSAGSNCRRCCARWRPCQLHPELAERRLPTQEGFFFGGTEYDEWYVDDLKETKRMVTEALADDDADYEYGSSW